MESQRILESIIQSQQEYYDNHAKSRFFGKSSQKNQCANVISQQYDLDTLFKNTLYILPEHKRIFFDYTLFKTYMNPNIFDSFLEHAYRETLGWVDKNDYYDLHINMNTLSISAFERYWPLIDKLFKTCPPISNKMSKLYVYYTPNMIEHFMRVLAPLISSFREKIVFYSKQESEKMINELLQN